MIHGVTGVRRTAAIFDLDRTLLPGSSLVYVAKAAVRHGLVSPWTVVRALAEDARFRRRGSSDSQVQRLHTRLLTMTAGLEAERVDDLVRTVAPRIVADLRIGMRHRLAEHRAAGDSCIVLSASPDQLVNEVALHLGADRGLGTRAEVVDGRLTGSLEGEPCYGPGKLARLFESGLGLDLAGSHAYADSASDIPLLRAVGHPVAVSPDRRLRAEAERRGWPVIESDGGQTTSRQSALPRPASAA